MKRIGIISVGVLIVICSLYFLLTTNVKNRSEIQTHPLYGSVNTFLNSYEQWKQAATKNGSDKNLVLKLGYSKALSYKYSEAHGTTTINLVEGTISVTISGLPDNESFDLWFVDNQNAPRDSVKPEPWDKKLDIGTLKHSGKIATLQTQLDKKGLKDFRIDLIVISPSGNDPGKSGLLFGSPSLFHRLYYSEQRDLFARLGIDNSRADDNTAHPGLFFPFNILIPEPAIAGGDISTSMAKMMAAGEKLFFEETFEGNGRTCGTCHPMENNLTIDPEFIAKLPNRDPLFVAEFNPKLKENFEKPQLMREFGLILENVDGFDDLQHKFVMRGVPHTLAMSTSTTQAAAVDFPGNGDGQTLETPPDEMTGWSGDGAPGGGRLNDFALGAVTQHFTKTLNRIPGKDFRLPKDTELDAMEAFQLSLGRQADPTLNANNNIGLKLINADAIAGKAVFINGGGNIGADGNLKGGKCITCHLNAGATSGRAGEQGLNRNTNTGIEDLPKPQIFSDLGIPRDGGFGRANRSPRNCTDAPSTSCGFGDSRFNTTPLIEAADTPPFFHNNIINTLEDAIRTFNGSAFNLNPNNPNPRANGAQILLTEDQIAEVAAFLRVINALENIRSSIQISDNALLAKNFGTAKKSLIVASAELDDAIQVLEEGNLHLEDAVPNLMNADALIENAMNSSNDETRSELINEAINEAISARGNICDPGSDDVLCPSE